MRSWPHPQLLRVSLHSEPGEPRCARCDEQRSKAQRGQGPGGTPDTLRVEPPSHILLNERHIQPEGLAPRFGCCGGRRHDGIDAVVVSTATGAGPRAPPSSRLNLPLPPLPLPPPLLLLLHTSPETLPLYIPKHQAPVAAGCLLTRCPRGRLRLLPPPLAFRQRSGSGSKQEVISIGCRGLGGRTGLLFRLPVHQGQAEDEGGVGGQQGGIAAGERGRAEERTAGGGVRGRRLGLRQGRGGQMSMCARVCARGGGEKEGGWVGACDWMRRASQEAWHLAGSCRKSTPAQAHERPRAEHPNPNANPNPNPSPSPNPNPNPSPSPSPNPSPNPNPNPYPNPAHTEDPPLSPARSQQQPGSLHRSRCMGHLRMRGWCR